MLGFTWSNYQSPPLLSRLDSFLISSDWLDLFPKVRQIDLHKLISDYCLILHKPTSDYCLILLDTKCERWGPASFRFELMWLEEKHLSSLFQCGGRISRLKDCWSKILALKIKKLKEKIKEWTKNHFGDVRTSKADVLEEIKSLDI